MFLIGSPFYPADCNVSGTHAPTRHGFISLLLDKRESVFPSEREIFFLCEVSVLRWPQPLRGRAPRSLV